MEPIFDFSWMRQMATGRVRERFDYHRYKAVGLEIPPGPQYRSPYHYRILFFSEDSGKPVLSLNLEASILGSYCFTEHSGQSHFTLGQSEADLSYDDFREWALKRADQELH